MTLYDDLRWSDYFFTDDAKSKSFWEEYLKNNRKIFFILGCGFDPRMCYGLEKLISYNSNSSFHCYALDYDEGDLSPSLTFATEKQENLKLLSTLIKDHILTTQSIKLRDKSGNTQLRQLRKLFSSVDDFDGYTDIVIDISALPIVVYYPLVAKILSLIDSIKDQSKLKIPNIHILVTENVLLDSLIKQQELDQEASYVFPFQTNMESEDPESIPRVWIPILGENQNLQIQKIATMVKPDEVTPIIPTVCSYPRRADNIFLEYTEILVRLFISPNNIVFGSEQNPFEVYRKIFSIIWQYRNSLNSLGICKIAISSLSSKLLSVSSFLVAYESKQKNLDIAMAQIFSKGFFLDKSKINSEILNSNKLFSLWISGDCYDSL